MDRFTISRHTGSKEGDHFDLMLEKGETLRTWRLQNTQFQTAQTARQIKDHRALYLDYEGEVSGKRGRVAIWDSGVYAVDEWKEDRIRVALLGKQVRMRLLLDRLQNRPPEEPDPRWTVIDGALEVRRAAAAFLRGASLEEAPTPELGELRTALAHEEQKLLALVGLYTRGGTVEWTLVEPETELAERIEREKVRWQHPWLAAARSYAERVNELSALLRRHRPPGSA